MTSSPPQRVKILAQSLVVFERNQKCAHLTAKHHAYCYFGRRVEKILLPGRLSLTSLNKER